VIAPRKRPARLPSWDWHHWPLLAASRLEQHRDRHLRTLWWCDHD